MTTANSRATSGLLVVEGQTDEHLVLHLCMQANPGLEKKFSRRDAKSVSGVLKAVRGSVNQPDLSSVGFMVDADGDPLQRWREVTSRIADANSEILIPDAPDPGGVIIAENPDIGSPRIGIWLMPDNTSAGELENFVVRMISGTDPVWPLSQRYIGDIQPSDRKFQNEKITKSQVHAWLATRKYPGLMGIAVREGDLAIDGELCQKFVAWLARLFA